MTERKHGLLNAEVTSLLIQKGKLQNIPWAVVEVVVVVVVVVGGGGGGGRGEGGGDFLNVNNLILFYGIWYFTAALRASGDYNLPYARWSKFLQIHLMLPLTITPNSDKWLSLRTARLKFCTQYTYLARAL